MPYILQEKRRVLDGAIDLVRDALRQLESDDESNNFEGNMNYVISSLIAKCYTRGNYRDINDVIGLLVCVKDEYNRKVVFPYEKQKEHDNGSVYPSIQQ